MTKVVKASPIEITKAASAHDAFQQIIEACLHQARANIESIDETMPDSIHQARIGFRRARSALRLFKRHLDKPARKTINGQLRAAGRQLSSCRDWDVFLAETLPRLEKRFELPSKILESVTEKRRVAYHTLVEQHAKLYNHSQQHIEVLEGGSIEAIAPDLLDRVHLLVRRACRHAATYDELHALRKAMKSLRYSVEFLSSLYDAKAVRSFLDHCREAQNVLGKLNDVITMDRLLRELDLPVPGIMQWTDHLEERAQGHLNKAIADVRSARPFWD